MTEAYDLLQYTLTYDPHKKSFEIHVHAVQTLKQLHRPPLPPLQRVPNIIQRILAV